MKIGTFAAASAAAMTFAGASHAAVVSLDFEGVNAGYPSGYAQVLDFYNGGTSSAGTSGVNYGVSFSANALAICLNTPGVVCSNTSRGGQGPGSDLGALFFLTGSQTFLNYATGFTTGFSFNYAEPNTQGGNVQVFDGLNGTGNLLANISLSLTPSTCSSTYSAAYCPFVPIGVTFNGVAKSIAFGGVANYVVFDDVTFGSATPGPGPGVPEPATWAMAILGMAAVGGLLRRRRGLAQIAA